MTLVRRSLALFALLIVLAVPAAAQLGGSAYNNGGGSKQRVIDETTTTTVAPRPTFRQIFQQWLERARARAANSTVRDAAKRSTR